MRNDYEEYFDWDDENVAITEEESEKLNKVIDEVRNRVVDDVKDSAKDYTKKKIHEISTIDLRLKKLSESNSNILKEKRELLIQKKELEQKQKELEKLIETSKYLKNEEFFTKAKLSFCDVVNQFPKEIIDLNSNMVEGVKCDKCDIDRKLIITDEDGIKYEVDCKCGKRVKKWEIRKWRIEKIVQRKRFGRSNSFAIEATYGYSSKEITLEEIEKRTYNGQGFGEYFKLIDPYHSMFKTQKDAQKAVGYLEEKGETK